MLSIQLWRWYINITITILDIIHRPVFYFKLNSTLYVCPYLTEDTLRLHYKPNRLMPSIGLWRWYINISITILDIMHRPVFYLKLNSSLYVCPYLTGNTLRLRYEPNNLMVSIGLWRWYINITISILNYPSSCFVSKTQRFGDWILNSSSSGTYSVGLLSISGPVSSLRNVEFKLKHKTMDNVQNCDSLDSTSLQKLYQFPVQKCFTISKFLTHRCLHNHVGPFDQYLF
jgi:hypothetical protein